MLSQKTILRGLLLVGLASLSGCSLLATSEGDLRWANYREWGTLHNKPITGDHTGFLGGLHEAAQGYRQVYVNATGLAVSQGTAPYRYPVGTVIVKEQFKNPESLAADQPAGLTIMVKIREDADNPAENWQWSRGYNKPASNDAFCSGCHTLAASDDFVFSNAQSLKNFQ